MRPDTEKGVEEIFSFLKILGLVKGRQGRYWLSSFTIDNVNRLQKQNNNLAQAIILTILETCERHGYSAETRENLENCASALLVLFEGKKN